MVERVFRLDDEPVAAMMAPRPDIVWLDTKNSYDTQLDIIARHPYSRFPIADGSLDRIRGIVDVRDICIAQRQSTAVDLVAMARAPLFVPDRAAALAVLRQLQTSGRQVAIVIDEHGGVDGLNHAERRSDVSRRARGRPFLPTGRRACHSATR